MEDQRVLADVTAEYYRKEAVLADLRSHPDSLPADAYLYAGQLPKLREEIERLGGHVEGVTPEMQAKAAVFSARYGDNIRQFLAKPEALEMSETQYRDSLQARADQLESRRDLALEIETYRGSIRQPYVSAEDEMSRQFVEQIRAGRPGIDLTTTYATNLQMAANLRHETALTNLQPLIDAARDRGLTVNTGQAKLAENYIEDHTLAVKQSGIRI
jgi:hypothetical protein